MYQNCIVPNSTPGFSYLTEHYNVSDDTLKNIIYKYRIEAEDPEAVPTDAYVQAQLGMTQYVDASPMAKQVWEKFYKSPKEFSSKEEFGKAKEEALTMFPAEAVKVYTNSKGHYVLAVREPVAKFEPKHRKDFSSWAEYNDYLLTMGELIPENERDVEKQVIGNQPFTFRDGTTVTVPFKPNSQQEEALNEINDFLKSNETAMTLSGYAGTGKTSLMEVIAQKAKKDGRNIVFSASTNKAAAVLRDRVKSAGFTAQTLNKVFGISMEEDSKKPYDANNLVNRLNEAKVLSGSVVVIDEASMINEENYKILNKIAEDNGLQIIYVGDKGQLAPVNEEKVSKVFRNNEGKVVTLTKVERTDDNAILKEATNIRNGKPLSGESSFNKDGKGVAYVKKSNKKATKDIVEKFVPMLRTNPDYFRILAYTNAAVAKYNEAVRRTLGYTDNTPRVNEPIVGYSNWGYTWDKNGGTYKFINSEAYKVTKVGSPKTITRTVGNTAVSLTATPVTIQDNMGNDQKVDFIDIKGNEENRKSALILAKEKARLKNEAWKLAKSSPRRAEMLQAANAIEEFLFVNDDIIDTESTNANGKHPTLQKKVFDFGYAMTVHKSQGSTFTHVLMDDADIATAKNNRSSWSNVSLNEDSGGVHEIDNIEIKESGNLFELVNNPDAAQAAVVDALNAVPSEESNNTNIRQQLEYVAVSRATDTVTVIANDGMVKKEDTPLNHLPQSKEAITKDITQQTLNQLEEIFKMAGGIKYENEMAKFLEKNPQWSSKIQMFIGKKARNQFEQQLMKARPDLATPAYNINGIDFVKDPFSDDYIPNRMDAATARKLQEEGIIKEGVFSPWALTDEGKAKSQISHPKLDSVLDFLHSLEDNKENTAYIKTAIRWITNRSITLPQDNVKARQAFDLARKKHLDLQKYSTLGELITAPEMQPKEKEKKSFDPDKAKTFSGKRTVTTEGGRMFTVYDVENTEKGQKDVCKALAAHYEMSPWCLSTFTATGEPTESAKHFWEHYNAIPRKIAYEDGKPVAFSSSDTPVHEEAWWDMQDVAPQRSLSDAIVADSKAKYAAELEGFDWDAFAVPEPAEPSFVERVRDGFIFQLRDAISEVVNEVADAQGIGQNYAVRQEVVDMYLRSMNFSINEVTQEMAEGDGRALADLLNQHVNDAFRYNVEQTIGQYYSLAEENRNTQPIAPIVEEDDILPFYKTSLGEVYGFVDSLDNMYLDRNVITAEHGIHEYTHIWDRYIAKRNPELWNTGVSIMKKTALWQEILNDENYGKAWQSMRGMIPEKLESLVASEVHSRLTGKRGKEIMDNLAKKKGAKKIIAQLKQWLVDFWTELKSAFTPWTDQELQALKDLAEKDIDKAIQMLSDMTLKDFTEGVNPILQEMQEVPGRLTKKQVDTAKGLLKNKIEHLQGQIEWIEERQKWNKATQKQLEELASLRQEISEEQALYDGLKTGESEMFINEYDVPQIRKVQQSAQQATVNIQVEAPLSSVESEASEAFVPHLIQLSNLEAETGERVVQVDAAWKEPILLDLDSQLGMDISEEEKAKIIQQMYRVKDAVSEEEYNKAPTAERQEVNDKMEDYWRRNNQMNALMENEVGLTPTEIREVSMQIVDSISDIISEIQADPEKAKDYFPSFSSTVDLKNATRKKIVEAVDINNLIKEAKRRFENIRYDESNSEAYDLYDDSFELLDQADLILENWETIMELAADEFLANEGFSIQRDTKGKRFKTQEREFTGYDYDNYVDPQDEQAIAEEGDEQEHWQVITRTIDAFNSMSDKVRLAYHNCYELDKDGNKILSKWGIPKRVNKVKAVSQTLRWTQGTLNIYEMIDALKKKEPRNPWLNQLINRLSDTSGKESDFQSQFYGVMHRHFQLYSIGQLENGVYASKTLNAHVALSDIMKSINAKYQMKSHPLFNGDGSVKVAELNRLRQNNETLKQMISKYGIRFENGEYSAKEPFSQEDLETIAQAVAEVSKIFGYTTSDNAVQNIITAESLYNMRNKLNFAIGNLEKAGKDYDPFNFEVEGNIRSEVMGFLTPIVEELEDAATNAFFDNGNMYQSYVIPSFLTQLFDSFKQPSEQFHKWVESFYGQSEWFKGKDGEWRLPWLEKLTADPKARELFEHKVQLNFNKHEYMRNMSPEEYTLSAFLEYFSERPAQDLRYTPVWFRVPIQSNKPSSEFIRFYADRSPAYKENIAKNLYNMFLQEVSRIDTVRKRNKQEGDYDYIASWDEQGRKFVFLPFLNHYLIDNGKLVDEKDRGLFRKEDGTLDNEKSKKLQNLLNKKINAEEKLSDEEESELMNLVQEATRNAMQIRVNNILNKWEKTGILKATEKIKGIKSLNHSVRENLKNFLWNDFYAANSILQLTVVDKAFYPHATELQKRLAELHAPGIRGNKFATDYKGNRVSDGFYRTLLLTEFDTFVANIIDNIAVVFDKKIANAVGNEKAGWEALKERLVGENGAYRSIEVTNAQGYSSPSSYRKKASMFGKWSQQAEEIYQKLLKGDYTLTDLEVAFQPLKPFVYGHLSKNMGVDNAPITKMPVPFQAKNAEYLLIMADALTRGEETGRPNLLRAIYDIMEQSEKLNPTMGIDTVQFTSAIKSGEQGSIDIAPFLTMEGGEAGARTLMEKLIYQDAVNDDGTKYNYDSFIHKTDYDNYALQQEVPPHFMDHSQAEGSQQRVNAPADLDFYDFDGYENYYSWNDPDGTEHKMNAKEFRKEYERVHAANIEDSFNKLTKELHLDSNDRRAQNLALSEILQNEIMSSPRYSISLFLACQIDPATGEFRIPKGDPIQAKQIEQLINSIIKNRVNKQKIAGGPIVQVSNFGTSRQLHIKFHDKQGNILMTREEYEKTNPQESFEEYLKKNQAGVAHFEIFAPIGMKSLFEKFKNPDGTINLEAVERCDPELLKVITGRIPNEDKYSIAHGKIVGFMPALAGDAIMFPWELTKIDDSDFDVDKRYTQRKVMDIVVDWSKVKDGLVKAAMKGLKAFQENNPAGYEKWAKKKRWGQSDKDVIMEQVEMLMDNPEQMKDADALMASMYKEYERILREDFPYKTVYPKKGTRDANNNQIIDMQWAVMSNEMTADKLLNPGGFEIPKHQAYVIAAYRNSNGTISWETLEGMTTKQLKDLATREMDLAWFDDHVQFYKQNAAGSNLIGVFAVNKTAHAILEGDGLLINVTDFCGEHPFTICDMVFEGMMAVDPTKDAKSMLVGKSLGSGIGASADTVKDPWLDSINVNMTTAGMFNALLRIGMSTEGAERGMPMEDAELFMAQDVIGRLMDEFNRRSLEEKTSIDQILQEKIDIIKKKHGYTDESEINLQPLTREELKKGVLPAGDVISEDRETIDYKTLLAFQKVKTLAKAIRKPTFVTRLNSISAAVGPLIIDNIILEHKLFDFLQVNADETTGFYVRNEDGTFDSVDMDDILFEHPILKQFSRPADSRNPDCPTRILFSDMPAGSSLFKSVLKALPSNISDKIYDDRQLLKKLSDFFQSYLLVANDVIDTRELKYFIEEFPKDFIGTNEKKGLQEKYPDNAFVQAIQLDYDKKSKRAYLNVNTTGMKEQEKERLRMAWADLHKADPELSTKLFAYAFFRGGIGFSPRTFMGLADYIKENIEGYVDTYRHFPRMDEQAMIEQFVRNNWENNTLAPMKGGENTKYDIDLENGTLFVRDEKDMADLKGVKFFKTKDDKHTYLWKLLGNEGANKYERQYVRIDPLGNNGEYVEISRERNMQAFDKTAVLEDRNETQELPENSPMETEASDADTPTTMPESESQQAKNVGMLIPYVMKQNPRATQESAVKQMQTYRDLALNNKLTSGHKAYLVNLFKQAGLVLTQEEAAEKFKEFC